MNDVNEKEILVPSEDGAKLSASQKPSEKKDASRKHITPKKDLKMAVAISGLVVLIAVCLWLSRDIIRVGTRALQSNYESSYISEKDRIYEELREKYRQMAEEKYRVSNTVSIQIAGLREISRLRVLEVTDTEYVVDDRNDNDGNIVSWIKVSGKANFVVDLQTAEFIVDSDRRHVLVRTQYPFLADEIEITDDEKLLFKDDFFDGSYKQGEELHEKQRREAVLLMEKEFVSNQRFYQSARDAAISSIECLVKQLNPEVSDLTVEVEFY